ncbi:hypothetical protein M413DRAFT_221743 [Hebeloma cylindrosporum]|uniref:Ribosome biogenesis protein SLX9 n=1 Tax=Hebeloma cylindrosporum TaxID=76867 RepID=A0A0C3CVG7_HEBCY|nr:hypothetical protein M413DRAFT_221743 [Hebeloma cylindrosporum h7]
MPKEPSTRHTAHHASVKLPTKFTTDGQDMIVDGALHDPQPSKKLKQVEKRRAFLQMEPSIKQFSRSRTRHLKHRERNQPGDCLHTGVAKDELGGGLGDLHSAIETMIGSASSTEAAAEGEASPKPERAIGKSASSTPSKSQRKRILELERLRHPLILNNSEFSSNPFQTIRTHTQNTIHQKGTAA